MRISTYSIPYNLISKVVVLSLLLVLLTSSVLLGREYTEDILTETYLNSEHRLPTILILLFTSQKNPDRLYAAKNTWTNLLPRASKIIWVTAVSLPTSIASEDDQMIIPDTGYEDLKKRVFAAFAQLAKDQRARDYDLVMKADDDTYIRIPILLERLGRTKPGEIAWYGHPYGYDRGWRGKQYKSDGHGDFQYCWGGPGYVLTSELFRTLSMHWQTCIDSTSRMAFMPDNKAISFGGAPEDLLMGSCIYNHTTLRDTGCQPIRGTHVDQIFRHREYWQRSQWIDLLSGKDEDAASVHSASPELMYSLWYLQDSPQAEVPPDHATDVVRRNLQ